MINIHTHIYIYNSDYFKGTAGSFLTFRVTTTAGSGNGGGMSSDITDCSEEQLGDTESFLASLLDGSNDVILVLLKKFSPRFGRSTLRELKDGDEDSDVLLSDIMCDWLGKFTGLPSINLSWSDNDPSVVWSGKRETYRVN